MGCGGSSLKDISSQAKTAIVEAKNTAEANGLEKAELLKTGKDAVLAIKDNGVNVETLKNIASENGIEGKELINTGKDLILSSNNGAIKEIKGVEKDLINNAMKESGKGLAQLGEGLTRLDQNDNLMKKESLLESVASATTGTDQGESIDSSFLQSIYL